MKNTIHVHAVQGQSGNMCTYIRKSQFKSSSWSFSSQRRVKFDKMSRYHHGHTSSLSSYHTILPSTRFQMGPPTHRIIEWGDPGWLSPFHSLSTPKNLFIPLIHSHDADYEALQLSSPLESFDFCKRRIPRRRRKWIGAIYKIKASIVMNSEASAMLGLSEDWQSFVRGRGKGGLCPVIIYSSAATACFVRSY